MRANLLEPYSATGVSVLYLCTYYLDNERDYSVGNACLSFSWFDLLSSYYSCNLSGCVWSLLSSKIQANT